MNRATGIAAVALVAVVGAGGLIYLSSKGPMVGGPTTPTSTQAPTTAPSAATTPRPTLVPTGYPSWMPYHSIVYEPWTWDFPADWTDHPATRAWQAGDRLDGDAPYADRFESPDQESVGLLVWEMPLGNGSFDTVGGLKAWAASFCATIGAPDCVTFTHDATPMCLTRLCEAALLVTTPDAQYAFFADRRGVLFADVPQEVRVVVVGRPDEFPAAARYGGSVELLKAVLASMDVWTPGQQPGA